MRGSQTHGGKINQAKNKQVRSLNFGSRPTFIALKWKGREAYSHLSPAGIPTP